MSLKLSGACAVIQREIPVLLKSEKNKCNKHNKKYLNFQFETKHITAKPKQTFKEKKENERVREKTTHKEMNTEDTRSYHD